MRKTKDASDLVTSAQKDIEGVANSIKKAYNDAKQLNKAPDNDSYTATYKALFAAGEACKTLLATDEACAKESIGNNIKILALAVYGWMPTILDITKKYNGNPIKIEDVKKAIEYARDWNPAKSSIQEAMEQFEIIAHFINNSYVGASKFLHFLFPLKFAIFDNNIAAFLSKYVKINECYVFTGNANRAEKFIIYEMAMRKASEVMKEELRDIEKVLFYASKSVESNAEETE